MDNLDEMELKLLRKMNQEKDAEITSLKEENERLRGKVEAYEPIVAAVESHLQRAMQILKGGKDE